jgi:lipopolysaccharide transport system ATP-binding protein
MSGPIISVRNLSKVYNLYDKPSDRFKEVLFPWLECHRPFHALHDISFDLYKGEHLGILGVNGAGKSTLLQVLTGVLTPTSGSVITQGNISALLELGAGFNPEMTGRENTQFLLSMTIYDSREIAKKTLEAAVFADIGDFFDQPMKLYSSGMLVRVAFAASAVSNPDILIVDEALAVGDVRFQKKCYDYIAKLKNQGTTFILVTHDILGAKNFCNRLMLLHQGRLIADGEPSAVATKFYQLLYPNETQPEACEESVGILQEGLSCVDEKDEADLPSQAKVQPGSTVVHFTPRKHKNYIYTIRPDTKETRWGAGGVDIAEVRVYGLNPPNILCSNELRLECDYAINSKQIKKLCDMYEVEPNLLVGMRLDTANGLTLFDLANATIDDGRNLASNLLREKRLTVTFSCSLPSLFPGDYFITPAVSLGVLGKFISICGYDNLILFSQEQSRTVLGLIRPEYTIERER